MHVLPNYVEGLFLVPQVSQSLPLQLPKKSNLIFQHPLPFALLQIHWQDWTIVGPSFDGEGGGWIVGFGFLDADCLIEDGSGGEKGRVDVVRGLVGV